MQDEADRESAGSPQPEMAMLKGDEGWWFRRLEIALGKGAKGSLEHALHSSKMFRMEGIPMQSRADAWGPVYEKSRALMRPLKGDVSGRRLHWRMGASN